MPASPFETSRQPVRRAVVSSGDSPASLLMAAGRPATLRGNTARTFDLDAVAPRAEKSAAGCALTETPARDNGLMVGSEVFSLTVLAPSRRAVGQH
jgi:hypothetical protein